MKITYYVAMSTDNFIARDDGDVSWLDEQGIDMNETGYDEFIASVDALVMGRATYDFVYQYGSWPYGDLKTWVCTSSELNVLEGAQINVARDIETVMREAKERDCKHMWLVGGGALASAFYEQCLLTDLDISVMPCVLDAGIPLFARQTLSDLPMARKEVLKNTGFERWKIELLHE